MDRTTKANWREVEVDRPPRTAVTCDGDDHVPLAIVPLLVLFPIHSHQSLSFITNPRSMEDPTPLTDPQGYLSLFKFNLKLPQCPRTNMPVSYSDIGDPNGIPVLFVPPSGCTRWFSAPQGTQAGSQRMR